jgi:D-sedoheptulose 7-phosphate isomerase
MNARQIISGYIASARDILAAIPEDAIQAALSIVEETYSGSKVLFIFGNGGSAATSSHIAEDLSKGCACKGKPSLKAMSLTDNTPLLTALSNDFSYDAVFEKQLEIIYSPGDTVLAISASGNSKNVIHGVEYAKARGGRVIGFTGFDGGKLRALSDANIHVPYHDFGLVEDMHLLFGHILTACMRQFIETFQSA